MRVPKIGLGCLVCEDIGDILRLYRGHVGIMEKKMETTI